MHIAHYCWQNEEKGLVSYVRREENLKMAVKLKTCKVQPRGPR
jgi:hypothetical protein